MKTQLVAMTFLLLFAYFATAQNKGLTFRVV